MARVMIVRHGQKGDGKCVPKNQLSPKGEADARQLGINLPESMRGQPIAYVGGSDLSRSTMTALLIALGAGNDPKILASQKGLGSEEQFLSMTTMDDYKAALAKYDGSDIAATRAVLAPSDYTLLKSQLIRSIERCGSIEENVILGCHSPWVQMLYEWLIDKPYNANARELDYVIVDVNEGDEMELVETSLPQE